jgi:hypothetical protein
MSHDLVSATLKRFDPIIDLGKSRHLIHLIGSRDPKQVADLPIRELTQ